MRWIAPAAVLAALALAAPAGAAQLVTWKSTTSHYIDPAKTQFNGVPPEAPAQPASLPVNVLLPDGYDPARRYPVLYLLHGHGDSYWSWFSPKNGDLVNTAKGLQAIVVMPEAGQGWYADWWNGGRRGEPGWESYHLKELIPLVERRLPIRSGRRWHAIAGLSMGGEATMYYASQRPGYFGAAAAFSPPVSIQRTEWPAGFNTQGQDYATVFGDVGGFYATGHNPLALIDNLRWTRLFVGVGDGTPVTPDDVQNVFGQVAERELRAHADEFVPAAQATGADITYDKRPGVHNWPYWRQYLKDAIAWGLFKPVVSQPRAWTFKTVSRMSEAWGFKLTLSAPPAAVETFKRSGGRLSATGSGRVTVRAPSGCTFKATLPFNRAVCRARPPRTHALGPYALGGQAHR
jgi:S-formylglutathione hydrolase FrmB